MNQRRQRLARAHLYLVCDAHPDAFVQDALRGGVDLVQLRVKHGSDDEIVATAIRYRELCHRVGALLIVNDRPDLARAAQADGVHVGQDDTAVTEARDTVGPDLLVGLSTHSPAQVDSAAEQDVDYIGVGPVHATPTKPGRSAVGLDLVRYAARHSDRPFFAIGGIDADNVAAVRAAGATRIAVVRALTEAGDPEAAARALRARVTGEVTVGAT